MLVTSREPLGAAGEVIRRVPSVEDEAIELFVDRARRCAPTRRHDDTAVGVADICRRLAGVPLASSLQQVRVLSPGGVAAGLHDRLRVMVGGALTGVRRQQTLLASVD